MSSAVEGNWAYANSKYEIGVETIRKYVMWCKLCQVQSKGIGLMLIVSMRSV
jgi:hypothetical protein